jgi:hypothetical protein
MSRNRFGWSIAGAVALAAGLAAQEPTQYPQTPTRTPSAQDQKSTVTVEGCLVREQDVPGRKPNVAERAGVMEDYILTNTKIVKGTAPEQASTAKPGEPVGTSAASPMYDVKGIDDEQLKQLVGKRVHDDPCGLRRVPPEVRSGHLLVETETAVPVTASGRRQSSVPSPFFYWRDSLAPAEPTRDSSG